MAEHAQTAPDESGSGTFITSPNTLARKIGSWQESNYHVLTPAIHVSTFSPGYGVSASLVKLDWEVDEKGRGLDVYFDKTTMKGDINRPADKDDRGLSKIGLGKIAAAAGVSWVDPYGRVDPLTIQHLWIYRVTGVYLAYDGTPQVIKGEKEIDYRDGSAQIGGWTPQDWRELQERNRNLPESQRTWNIGGWSDSRVRQARMNGAERAETGAVERAIRMGFGIKHAYTIAELKRPFVALRVCPLVDMTDPAVRRMVAEGQLAGVASLYAGQGRQGLPEPSPSARKIIDVGNHRRETEPVRQVPADSARYDPPATQAPPAAKKAPKPRQSKKATDGTAALPQPGQMPPAQQTQTTQQPAEGQTADRGADPEDRPVVLDKVVHQPRTYGESHAKAGQEYTKWIVVTGDGFEASTVYPRWGDIIDEAFTSRRPVVMRTQEKSWQGKIEHEILNIRLADGPLARNGAAETQAPAARQAAPQGRQAGFRL